MKFDASTSKLYQQIMEAAVTFLGLDAATATETDVHAAIDGKETLAAQLEAARTAAVADLQKQFDTMKTEFEANKTKLTDLQTQFDNMKTATETKDGRITELQTEVAAAKKATDDLKVQHKTETERLAGELAAAKAGKAMQVEVAGDVHDASKPNTAKGETKVIVANGDALANLTKRPTV